MSFIDTLLGPPNPDLALFGQFVGDWEMTVEFYDEVRTMIYRGLGAWTFAYVLDGRAVQDVFTYPLSDGRGIGTTLRTRDAATGQWQIIYVGAVSGAIAILHGGRAGTNIELTGTDADGHNRWTFSDIEPDSFTWTGELSADGVTWRTNHRMWGTRRA